MNKEIRLRKNREFQTVYRRGKIFGIEILPFLSDRQIGKKLSSVFPLLKSLEKQINVIWLREE